MNNLITFIICACFLLGCSKRAAPSTPIKLDGTVEKWLSKTPVWDNGPVPADKPPADMHILKVFLDNDSRYLYAFIQCSPTVQERFKVTQSSGSLGDIFIDPENNPDTGSPARRGAASPNSRGYKLRVYLPTGVYAGTSGSGTFTGYTLYRFTGQHLDDNHGFNAEIPNSSQESRKPGALIADGKDGVELAIPLEMLGLRPGMTARFMFEPSILSPRVGFTSYRCR